MHRGILLLGAAFFLALSACHRQPERTVEERVDSPPKQWSALSAVRKPRLGLGSTATPEQIAPLAITVLPDGRGLPQGHGSVSEGEQIYAGRCAACHGEKGEGQGDFPKLVGGQGTLATASPVATIGSFWPNSTTVFDYIHRAMPYNAPGSLTADDTYAVTAYLLHLNGIVGPKTVLDQGNLASVKMPNRNGFVGDPRPDVGRRRVGTERRP